MMIPRRLSSPFNYFLCWFLWPLILTTVCCWSLAPPKFSSKSSPPSRATNLPRPTSSSFATTTTTARTPPLNFQQEDDSAASSSFSLLLERDPAVPVPVVPRPSSWIPRLAFVVVSQFHHRLSPQSRKFVTPSNQDASTSSATTTTTLSPFVHQHKSRTTTTTPTAAAFVNLDSFGHVVSLSTATSITSRRSGLLSNIPQDIPPLGQKMDHPVEDDDDDDDIVLPTTISGRSMWEPLEYEEVESRTPVSEPFFPMPPSQDSDMMNQKQIQYFRIPQLRQ